jgi:NfeD-like C-terminal, partner-binding
MSLTVAPKNLEFFTHAEIAEVEETITLHQRGRVRFEATYWFARFYNPQGPIESLPGTCVKVIGREGLTLLVMPSSDRRVYPPMPRAEQSAQWGWMQQISSQFLAWL